MSYAMTFEEECRREGELEGERRGRLEGEQQGERRGKLEVARNMLNAGMSFSDVQRITRLSGDELKALRS